MLTLSRWKVTAVILSVIFGIVFSLPNVLPQKTLDALPGWVPHQKLNLGLDLQGGSYLLYEVDTDALRAERLTNMVEDVRTTLSALSQACSTWAWPPSAASRIVASTRRVVNSARSM